VAVDQLRWKVARRRRCTASVRLTGQPRRNVDRRHRLLLSNHLIGQLQTSLLPSNHRIGQLQTSLLPSNHRIGQLQTSRRRCLAVKHPINKLRRKLACRGRCPAGDTEATRLSRGLTHHHPARGLLAPRSPRSPRGRRTWVLVYEHNQLLGWDEVEIPTSRLG
jgi:hypothetical protein